MTLWPRKSELWDSGRHPLRKAPTTRPLGRYFLPPADICETNESIVVMAEMPGVGPGGVDITLERRVLTIRGQSSASEHTGYQRVYNEYAEGDYERGFTLSDAIDRDRIEATLQDGVLHLVLPNSIKRNEVSRNVATPTPIQAQAFSLLAIDPAKL